jgi:predicted Zn-dependent peptidase
MNRWAAVFLALLQLVSQGAAGAGSSRGAWRPPVVTRTFANGLTVVVSEDHSAPTFALSTVYRIGFRLEPKGRSGFAHLFEHMMFQGTPAAPKGVLNQVVEGGGGALDGTTNADYTNYGVSAPISALDPVLWLEADRMKHLDFSAKNLQNQQSVVQEEIRTNVTSQPYGLFYWTDLNDKAFDKWENRHDGYGSFADLEAATLADVETFFNSYYGPNNAVIALVGDVTPEAVFSRIEKYFGGIPPRPTPARPDVAEGLNTAPRMLTESGALAQAPAVAIGWKMPARGSRDHIPAAVLAHLLLSGEAARLYQRLVRDEALMPRLEGGLNWPFGDAWSYDGPSLLVLFGTYKTSTDAAAVVSAVDAVIAEIARHGVPVEELRRTEAKMISDFYASLEPPASRATFLAVQQLFSGRATLIGELPAQIEAVTSADLQRVAATYLTAANRTVIDRWPVSQEKGGLP